MLDGIGETALIARYPLDGNVKDWSRNNLHASGEGGELVFAVDDKMDKVLSLSGRAQVLLPRQILEGRESLSMCGWVKLTAKEPEQYLLYLTGESGEALAIAPSGTKEKEGLSINTASELLQARGLSAVRWQHFALVYDAAGKTLACYVNAQQLGMNENIDLDWNALSKSLNKPRLTIGDNMAGQLSDFRFYSIALDQKQLAGIYNKALHQEETVEEEPVKESAFSAATSQLYNSYLLSVEDVVVTTAVGHLPRLPRWLEAVFEDGVPATKVRVLWPSPKDNSEVKQAGTYTVLGRIPGSDLRPRAQVMVEEAGKSTAPECRTEAFALEQVSLNPALHQQKNNFIENRDKFIDGLAASNPDDFLYMFRNAYGQEQPEGARALGVWDSQETKLRGHATGHYLSALAQAYASTGYDKELQSQFAEKMTYMVEVLSELSQLSGTPQNEGGGCIADPTAVLSRHGDTLYDSDLSAEHIRTDYWNWGKGYISAYAPDQFIMLEYGAKYGTDNTKIWAPYYTLHKILAGLLDVYEISGNEQALSIVEGMADWVYARLSQLPEETLTSMWKLYIAGEFGGMNDAMARLSRLTGESKYLDLAQLFDNTQLFFGNAEHTHGLAKNVDMFRGLHANQHIPQIMGALEIYRVSGDQAYFDIAENFWFKATGDYMYSIGGVAGASNPANAECFTREPATLFENGFSKGGQNETCATYNLLKLSRHLFFYHQDAAFMDYYERALYNHILASVAEHSPANTYHVPLRPASVKHFGNADMHGFTCCNGTALESHTKLQNSIYFKSVDNKTLYVNLYVPSTLKWEEKGVELEQSTAFPKDDKTRLRIKGKGEFDLKVRVPQWARAGFFVSINGEKQELEAIPGTYLTLSRKWKDGDVVELQMPFQFRLEPVMDQQNLASLFYGPVLLAAQEKASRETWRRVTLNAKDLRQSITGNPDELEFYIDGVEFKPFYESYGRYSVYFDAVLEYD